jgi:hypothetical protein
MGKNHALDAGDPIGEVNDPTVSFGDMLVVSHTLIQVCIPPTSGDIVRHDCTSSLG